MKKWTTLIELIVVMAVLTIIMAVWSLKISNNSKDKAIQSEIISVYNTLNNHNKNITRWKWWGSVQPRTIIWNTYAQSWLIISGRTLWNWNIAWKKIEFALNSWSTIILWQNIELSWQENHNLYLNICKKPKEYNAVHQCEWSGIIAQIRFTEIANNITLIWTGEFSSYNQ